MLRKYYRAYSIQTFFGTSHLPPPTVCLPTPQTLHVYIPCNRTAPKTIMLANSWQISVWFSGSCGSTTVCWRHCQNGICTHQSLPSNPRRLLYLQQSTMASLLAQRGKNISYNNVIPFGCALSAFSLVEGYKAILYECKVLDSQDDSQKLNTFQLEQIILHKFASHGW